MEWVLSFSDNTIPHFPHTFNKNFYNRSKPQKYENVQKGVGGIMGGALIETEARTILNQGIRETKKQTALKLLKRGKQTVEEIAEDTGLSVAEVERLAGLQTV